MNRQTIVVRWASLALLGLFLAVTLSVSATPPSRVSASTRSQIRSLAAQAKSTGAEADLGALLNADLPKKVSVASMNFNIKGQIRPIVGGRNFTAADVDSAEIPIYTPANGNGANPLLHDGGEWPNTGGNTQYDDGRSSFGNDWAGEFYDIDQNGHYPKAVLRYIGSHCYIFVPPMFFPTLPRGISSTEEPTPAPKSEWGLYWPDSPGMGETIYFAPATGARYLDPRYVLGSDKNSARLKLKELADEFDAMIYAKLREYYGNEPDIDGDSKIFILLDDIRDGTGTFRGYFWAGNQYPRTTIPESNEKEMIHIDLYPTFVSNPKQGYRTTAHEFVHMIHFNEGISVENGQLIEEERWLEEGWTQYGTWLYDQSHTSNVDSFIRKPDTILVEPRLSTWMGSSPFANYGASYLFVYYVMEKYGKSNPATFMRNWFRDKAVGITSIDNALRAYNTNFNDVFCDWVLANFIDRTRKADGSPLNDGKWGYNIDNDYDTTNNMGVNESLPVKYSEQVLLSKNGTARSANLSPWAADYIGISGYSGNLNLGFDGDDTVTFRCAVIKRGPQVDPAVEYFYLNDKQAGNLLIKNYGAGNTYENLVLVPIILSSGNYEKLNYIYSGTFADLKVALFPNPVFENELHVIVRTTDKFAAAPRVQMTYGGKQGYLVMTPVNDGTYLTNYSITTSGEGVIEANGTNSNGVILSNILKFSAVYYPAKSSGLLQSNFGKVSVPAGAFNKAGWVLFSTSETQTSYPGVSRISSCVNMALPAQQSAAPLQVSVPYPIKTPLGSQVGLFRETETGVQFVSRATLEGDQLSASLNQGGTLFFGVDTIAPAITGAPESAPNGRILLNVADLGAGIDPESIEVKYNQTTLPVRYDSASQKLIIDSDGLLDGNYPFDVSVSDRLGNKVSTRILARVSGTFALAQCIAWPNPARTYSRIRCAFTGANALNITGQVTILDVAGDEVTTLPLQSQGGGLYDALWNLQNRQREIVGNGVYYAIIEAWGPDGDIKERRKIAVLR